MSTATIKKSEVTEFQQAAAVFAYNLCDKTMNIQDLLKGISNKVQGIEGNNDFFSQLEPILSGHSTHFDQLWRSEEIPSLDPEQNSVT